MSEGIGHLWDGASERRAQLLCLLASRHRAITGAELAHQLGVSRQVIVQDIAILRAGGAEVLATPQGYLLAQHLRPAAHQIIVACRHTREQVGDELTALVDCGVTVVDVIVEHPIYGEQRAPLWLRSRADVRDFVRRLEEHHATLLSSLTGGVHLHTLEADSPERLDAARAALDERGYLLRDEP